MILKIRIHILIKKNVFFSVEVGAEEKKKKAEAYQDADIDEREPDINNEKSRAGGGGESSDEEAVVRFNNSIKIPNNLMTYS